MVFCKLVVKNGLGQEAEGLVIDSRTFCTNSEFVYNVLLIGWLFKTRVCLWMNNSLLYIIYGKVIDLIMNG